MSLSIYHLVYVLSSETKKIERKIFVLILVYVVFIILN